MRCQKISPRLGGELEEKYNLISKDWGYDRVKMEFEEELAE